VGIRISPSFKHQNFNCLLSVKSISDGNIYVHYTNTGCSTLCAYSGRHEPYVYASAVKLLWLIERAAFEAKLYSVQSTYISAVCMCASINFGSLPPIR
jgi:hypothetical protein